MTIWKMNLSYKGNSNFAFCKERNIIGHGWALQKYKTTDYQEYIELTKLEEVFYQNGKFDYALQCAINGFLAMQSGDLVVLHDMQGNFHICIVVDEPVVNQEDDFCKANVTCNRKVRFLPKVLTESELWELGIVPKHCIARHTMERIHTADRGDIEDYVKENFSSYLS